MSTKHAKTLEYQYHGLTLILGENIGDNAVNSMRHAYHLQKSMRYGEVVYLNTFQGDYKLNKTMATAVSKYFDLENQTTLNIVSSTLGELVNERGMMEKELAPRALENPFGFKDDGTPIEEKDVYFPFGKEIELEKMKVRPKVIVMNSWEFAAKDCRQRERLIFMINEWITMKGISVIIYAEDNNRTAKPGKMQRGGFGKLMGLADKVVQLRDVELQRDEKMAKGEETLDTIYAERDKERFHLQRLSVIAAMYKMDEMAEQKKRKEEEEKRKAEEEKIKAGQPNIIVAPVLSFGKDHPENADSVDDFLQRRSTPVTEGVYTDIVESEELVAVAA